MDENEIISRLIDRLNQDNIWFTQKTDPTWEEAKQYYKLDEYGNLTDGSVKQIVKEIKNYIGDGAIDTEDAIEMWIREAFMEYKIAYKETLITKFKDKPVVDQIEAYESQVLTESVSMESLCDVIDNANSTFQIAGAVHAMGYVNDGVASIMQNQFSTMKKNGNNLQDIKDKLIDTITANMVDDVEKEKVVASKNIKTENVKRRLKEENNKSQNIISDMLQAEDFDAESNSGKIVMRTSDLFNALSSNGYDVQVSFDNGESTNSILLGQQGGQVIITINDSNKPLEAFTSGNFEINEETLKTLNDIQETIINI